MILKCKMCGGDITFTPGATYGTCEYCGSTSTIPQADDEQKLNRYNRANHFRRQCEFDKALAAYEKILEQDDADAEAHWGAVLSRYGIEYVEDPATKKRIPTCHRVQIASILADADYLAAVENAPDAESRRLYEEQAAQIADIQKGILAISTNEKPYDIFICYKETDESGQRTRDSQWAQEVYYGLTDAGYKVFFSRITLEDKLGQQYEPYIFAALNSARVMVVIGSRPEYFSAVWVKNEWSRYLALMANDRKRLLIPCYRGMDPYDLPEELSNLQSQDMSKISFMQDLLRGVKKVLDADKAADAPHVVQHVVQTSSEAAAPGISNLMERAYLFMEDSDFTSAGEYLERVLDSDPKYAPAYAAKACIAFGMCKESQLAEATFLYEDNTDWQKALRFADGAQKAIFEGYIANVRDRVNLQIRNYAFDCAVEMAVKADAQRSELDAELAAYKNDCQHSSGKQPDGSRRANNRLNEETFKKAVQANEPGNISETNYRNAAEMFETIRDKEAAECAKQCLALAEQARQKKIYQEACERYHQCSKGAIDLEEVAKAFESIPDYQDARKQAQKCLEEAEAIRSSLYDAAVQSIREAGNDSAKWRAAKEKLARRALSHYRNVEELRDQAEKRYIECIDAEKEKARREAEAAAKRKKRATVLALSFTAVAIAIIVFVTQVIIPKGHYAKAVQLRANGQWAEAVAAFAEAGNYSDARTQSYATYYMEGETKRELEDWEGAVTAFTNAGNYSDAAKQITETHYQHAQSLMKAGDYKQAYAVLVTLKGYADVDSLLASDENLLAAAAAREAMFSVGNYVIFGTYPQTKSGNDETPIEWLVLARNGDNALLLSRYGLDAQPYNEKPSIYITWEKCTLRTWLNDDFINRAFTAEEQAAILLTDVDNSDSQCYSMWSTSGGNNTQDKIFLLSDAEANKYLDVTIYDNTKSRVAPTPYAIAQGAYTWDSNKTADGQAAGQWWLRSPGFTQDDAAYVRTYGSLGNYDVGDEGNSVRPALWVNLESGIF